jgi:4-amino-4-deoxy-L-arabinose transferase-like glycosyltransferase
VRQTLTRRAVWEWPLWAWLLPIALIWFGLLQSVALTPPADNLEQLTWQHSLQWGYYKHPPLPTWLAWGAVQSGLHPDFAVALLGATLTLISFWIYAAVVREVLGPRSAWLALLAALCVTFYNGRINYFNHNTVLTLWVSVSAWLCWQIRVRPRLRWWVALGLASALGMLSKYQYAVTLFSILLLVWRWGLWKDARHRRGMAWGLLAGLVVMLPHLAWLHGNPHTPMDYAMATSVGVDLSGPQRLRWVSLWAADWLLNRSLPALLVLLMAWVAVKTSSRAALAPGARAPDPTPAPQNATALLHIWGWAPIAFMATLGLAWGAELQLQWGTAFALWTIPALMLALGLNEAALHRGMARFLVRACLACFTLIQSLLLAESYVTSAAGPAPSHPMHWRQFPSAAMAHDILEAARAELGGPIDLISGPMAPSAALALRMPERPLVLIDGDPSISPWVHAEQLCHARILQLYDPGNGPEDAHRTLQGWEWAAARPDPADPLDCNLIVRARHLDARPDTGAR